MRSTVPRWISLRCAALLLALAGLLAMHGLGEHGTHDPLGSMPAMGAVSSAHVAGDVASWAPAAPSGAGLPMGLAATCLAVLGLLLLTTALLALRRPSRPLWTGSSQPARVPAARGRAPDPPGLSVLSVRRC